MRSPPQLVIRPKRAADDAFIVELAREAFTEYSLSASWHTEKMASTAHTLIAEHGDAPIGLSIVDVRGGAAHLAAIAVQTDWRGLGVGRALLRAAEALASAKGARELDLTTADSNLAALELFLLAGYERRRRHARYYARGQHAIEMYKRL